MVMEIEDVIKRKRRKEAKKKNRLRGKRTWDA